MAKGLISGAAAAGRRHRDQAEDGNEARQRESHLAAGRGVPIICRSLLFEWCRDPRSALLPLRSRWPLQLRRNSACKRHFYLASCVPSLRTQHNIPRLPANHFDGQCELDAAQASAADWQSGTDTESRRSSSPGSADRDLLPRVAIGIGHDFAASGAHRVSGTPSERQAPGPRYPSSLRADFAAEISANPLPCGQLLRCSRRHRPCILRRAGRPLPGWPIAA